MYFVFENWGPIKPCARRSNGTALPRMRP